jgi:hypothetical protein
LASSSNKSASVDRNRRARPHPYRWLLDPVRLGFVISHAKFCRSLRGGNREFPPALSVMRPRDKRLLALIATILAVMFICKLYPAV